MVRKAFFRYGVLLLNLCFLFLLPVSLRADTDTRLNDGKKWRIGYYEGGEYSEYRDTMRTFINGLIELGWIEDQNPPEIDPLTPKPYWDWLVACNSPYLSFKAEDAYSADWDDQRRSQTKKAVMKKLQAGDIDLVVAMGTWAGQDLANNEHSVPTMVMSTSDPIKAGIIQSAENSGFDHVTARVDPSRYLRQIRMFHRIVGFKSLGVAFENTPDGRIYSAMKEVRQVAGERGFQVVSCEVIDSTSDIEKSNRSCMDCYRRLTGEADAVYITANTCVDRLVAQLAEIFRENGVPSFSMIGSKYVRDGIMLSISSDSGYTELGRYNAAKFANILNGVKPITLKQVFEDPLEIAVNMETVKQIGFDIPEGLLRIANEIYDR